MSVPARPARLARVPHHYGVVDIANELDPERRVFPDRRTWSFRVSKFYRDPLSDQIPSERGIEIWQEESPLRSQDFQWHQEQTRKVVRDKLGALSWIVQRLTARLRDDLSAYAPMAGQVFRLIPPLTGVGLDGQMLYQHARLTHAAQQLEVDLLMAMPPHEREARFKSARVEATLSGRKRAGELEARGPAL